MVITTLCISAAALSAVAFQHEQHHQAAAKTQGQIPSSIAAEHKELHENLNQLMKFPGATGKLARDLAIIMEPHFRREEEFGLPPLTALKDIAAGNKVKGADLIVSHAAKLKKELPSMLKDHEAIGALLSRLTAAARAEGRGDAVEFATRLAAHAKQEEEILYPAAILAGDALKKPAMDCACCNKMHATKTKAKH